MSWSKAARDKHWEKRRSDPDGFKTCVKCDVLKPYSEFHKHQRCLNGINTVCILCRRPLSQEAYKKTSKEYRLFMSAKGRAKRKGLEFNLTLDDVVIPVICPVFKTPIKRPSLDRLDNTKGYIKGNVFVISYRANCIKNNATIEELFAIVRYIQENSRGGRL